MLSEKNKIDKKPAEKRRSKSPKKSPTKKKPVKNTYDIVQFKKMVGKDIITYHKPCKYLMIDDVKYKERIINNMVKTIFLSGYIFAKRIILNKLALLYPLPNFIVSSSET